MIRLIIQFQQFYEQIKKDFPNSFTSSILVNNHVFHKKTEKRIIKQD